MVFVAAFAMMAASACVLARNGQQRTLTPPGVKLGPVPIFDEKGRPISSTSVILPDNLVDMRGTTLPITAIEAAMLPRDTTFGRRLYTNDDDFQTEVTVVLMGLDRASIHRPQWCLEGVGWRIMSTEEVEMPMTRPYPYLLPVNRMFLSRDRDGKEEAGVYVYWYASKNSVTAKQLGRLWSTTWKALTTGARERWAYISYFAECPPGMEAVTFARMEKVIAESTPEFQLVAGVREPKMMEPMVSSN